MEPSDEPREEEVVDDLTNLDAMFDASVKKKKKKKKDKDKKKDKKDARSDDEEGEDAPREEDDEEADEDADMPVHVQEDSPSYDYVELLERVYDRLRVNNPELTDRKRHTMKPPQVSRVGTTRTCWANFMETCTIMQRSPEHVMSFFLAELGTDGSLDQNKRFLIRGKFVPKKIESLLRKYIAEYLTCQMCKSPVTTLTRDAVTRIYFVNCSTCGASRSVAAIRQGYHAVGRGERRKARQ